VSVWLRVCVCVWAGFECVSSRLLSEWAPFEWVSNFWVSEQLLSEWAPFDRMMTFWENDYILRDKWGLTATDYSKEPRAEPSWSEPSWSLSCYHPHCLCNRCVLIYVGASHGGGRLVHLSQLAHARPPYRIYKVSGAWIRYGTNLCFTVFVATMTRSRTYCAILCVYSGSRVWKASEGGWFD
jgi:hypothetical protein